MGYCNIHGRYEGDGCSTCRDVEEGIVESLARSREDLAETAVYIAHAQNNPGDYDCPSCKFQTLKLRASRCPKCHANIGREYWAPIEAAIAAAERAATEKWERERPAREAEADRNRAMAEAYRVRDKLNKVIIGVGIAVWLYELVDIWRQGLGFDSNDGLVWLLTGAVNIVLLAIGGGIMGFIIGVATWAAVTLVNFVYDQIYSD